MASIAKKGTSLWLTKAGAGPRLQRSTTNVPSGSQKKSSHKGDAEHCVMVVVVVIIIIYYYCCCCCCCCCPRVRLRPRPRLKLMMVVFTTSLPWRAPPCCRPGLAGICGLQKPLDAGKGANVTSKTLDMFCMSLVRCPTYCWHGGFCTKHTETLHFNISCCCCCYCFSSCSCFCSCFC